MQMKKEAIKHCFKDGNGALGGKLLLTVICRIAPRILIDWLLQSLWRRGNARLLFVLGHNRKIAAALDSPIQRLAKPQILLTCLQSRFLIDWQFGLGPVRCHSCSCSHTTRRHQRRKQTKKIYFLSWWCLQPDALLMSKWCVSHYNLYSQWHVYINCSS